MEPKFQTSFIPKSPVTTQTNMPAPVSRGHNIFSVLATIIFVLTLVAGGAAFAYQDILTGQIATDSSNLDAARASFQPATIQQLVDANSRIVAVKSLLAGHVALSSLLALLQNLTVQKVQFNNLLYTGPTADAGPSLSMNATAATYNALAQQEAVFSANQFIQNPQFSNFNLGVNGTIQ